MFDFKETSDNFGHAFEQAVRNVVDEYRPQLMADLDEAIEKIERSLGGVADSSISRLSTELNQQISFLRQQTDDSIRRVRTEMSTLVQESITGLQRKVVWPMVLAFTVMAIAFVGGVGYLFGTMAH